MLSLTETASPAPPCTSGCVLVTLNSPFHELPLARVWCPFVLPAAGVQCPQSLQMCWRSHLHHPCLCLCSKFSLFKDILAALRCPHCSKAAEHLEEPSKYFSFSLSKASRQTGRRGSIHHHIHHQWHILPSLPSCLLLADDPK